MTSPGKPTPDGPSDSPRVSWGDQLRYLSKPELLEEVGPPRFLRAFLFLVALSVFGSGAWASIAKIKETTNALGEVVPIGSVHAVQHLEGGIIASILVAEGDLVGLLAACAVTPEPMTEEQRQTRVAADLKFVDGKRFAPTQPISLYKAMARAVAFNLQHSVRQIERDIAKLELEQANLEAWPDIAGDTGYNRDSVVTSTDTDRNIRTGSFGATWNLLDLGVSYARAQQSADRVLIAEERRRKGLQDIIRNVRLAYWKAVGAQRLMTRMAAIERDFSAGLAESRRLESNNVESRRRTVGFRRGLIDTVRQLISARKDYSRARLEFAQLINIRPGVNFTLQPPDSMQGIPALPVAVEEMASFALANRPELRVEDYNERVTDWESREALYSMFPGLDLNLTRNFSSDAGLVNTSWTGVGAQLGMNLFRLFSGPLRMQAAERRGELARRQRLALSVAVLAQVHIAFQEYRETRYQFRLARQISRSDRELSKMAMRERAITRGNRLDVVDVAARELRSEVEQHRAYVELRRAHGDLLHSLGLDVIPDNVPLDDIDGLRIAIRHTVAKWENLSEDTDPANDGTIEELVGQVFADIRRDTIVPGEPVGGAWPGPATTPEFEMQGMIGRAAGSVAEKTKGPTAPIIRSLAGLTPTEPGPLVIAPSDLADMALAMTDQAMAGNGAATAASGATGSTPAAGKVIEPPAALDVANDGTIEELVGRVVADIRRDTIVPGEPVGGAWLGPATTPEFEMQGDDRPVRRQRGGKNQGANGSHQAVPGRINANRTGAAGDRTIRFGGHGPGDDRPGDGRQRGSDCGVRRHGVHTCRAQGH